MHVVLILDGRPCYHDGSGVLLDGELDVATELPASGRSIGVERATVVTIHFLAKELAAEALLGVVGNPGEGLAAYDGGMSG